jgi:hypothetical protein
VFCERTRGYDGLWADRSEVGDRAEEERVRI